MLANIKCALRTEYLEETSGGGSGCISEGSGYMTDKGKVFIKRNGKEKARVMFDGELESLKCIAKTKTIRVPVPYLAVDNPDGGAALVMEYIDLEPLRSQSTAMGEQLARLHLHNVEMENKVNREESCIGNSSSDLITYESRFGFHVPTCCGFLPQDNSWCDEWVIFYTRKLNEQMNMLEKESGDREARDLWSHLQLKIPQYFTGITVKPSLLHGDLWSGNAAQTNEFPVVFDPSSLYGHSEYDLAIASMFGGFNQSFWNSYNKLIPKAIGWNQRHKLYKLFHNLNHWNHFGSGYRSGSLQIMRDLCN